MPHIELKVYPGYGEEKLKKLSELVARDAVDVLGVPEKVVSVAYEEVKPEDWEDSVFKPLIDGRDTLLKAPRY